MRAMLARAARPAARPFALPFALPIALPIVLIVLAWSLLACTDDGADSARARYNQALEDYGAGRLDEAATGFLDARDRAGVDPELRFSSAFNLGLTYARQADAAGAAPEAGPNAPPEAAAVGGAAPASGPEAAMNSLRQSAAWFRDAVRLDPESEDARVNLEVVLRRIQILADQLNQGQNSLEARLGRVIEDQRALRDQIRELMQRVAESGAEAEPVAFEGEFDTLATFERRLMADTGTVSDLAGEELGLLRGKEQRSEEEEVRVVQLGNLDVYLQTARGELADTRRLLRRLSGDKAHRRSDVALAALKRAQEQLLDPVTVLRGIAEDQVQVLGHTVGLDQLGKASIQVGAGAAQGDPAAPASAPAAPPAWLTTEHLRERQDILKQRTDEVLARFQAGVTAAEEQPDQQPDQPADPSAQDPAAPPAGAPQDPRQKRMLAQAADAIPFLQQAVGHMDAAAQALAGAAPGQGLAEIGERQGQALEALLRAIERFSDIRGLIELVYRDHAMTSALLTPPDAPEAAALPPEIAALPTDERARRIQTLVGQNLDRLTRLGGLFEDEVSVLDAQAAQAGQGQAAPGQGAGQGAGQMPPEQIEAARQQYLQAQGLRTQAEEALTRLRTAMAAGNAAGITEARAASAQGMEHIEALRRLFFSIVEHLKELLQSQTNTHDQTGSAAAGPDEELASRLGTLAEPQGQHAATGDALAQALAEQSDAAAQAPQAPQAPGAPGGADAAKQLAEAAQEVTQASSEMHGAADFLRKDADAAQTSSVDVSPTLQAQQRAMEHLQNAIRLLEPPREDQQQEQQDQQEPQEQQEQQQQEEQQAQEMSQSQAQRRLQEIRDREAERRRQQQPFKPEPVEKDW
jgi:hypothetical protein